jgi:PAS domain S-box-containing protein
MSHNRSLSAGGGSPAPSRLLLLEDDVSDAELAERTLRRSGLDFTLRRVATRESFVQALRKYDPDIILVDFRVPGFDGLEAVRLAKELRADLPVILVTGVLSDDAAGDFIKLGINDYVLKDRLARLPAAIISALSEAEGVRARRRAETSRDELARILECAQDGVIGTDNAGIVTAWNASAARIFHRAATEAVGRPLREVLNHFYSPQIEAALGRMERDAALAAIEVQCEQGTDMVLSLALSPIRDGAGGSITGTSLIIRDITNERRLQRQLRETTAQLALLLHEVSESNIALQREIQTRRGAEAEAAQARQEAERANKAKTSYLSDVSHEIRTPMTSIIGFADLLLASELSECHFRKVHYIREAAQSLLSIVNDIVDISAIESGRLRLTSEPTNLRSVVKAVLATVEPSVAAKKLTLRSAIAPEVPEWVQTDPQRLRQILLNLIGNAVKFTNEGGITVVVQPSSGRDDPMTHFSVVDTGIGIPTEKQHQLFTEFYRVGQSGAREQEGSGLGLAISRHLVEVMGGTIGVTSREQQGSTFWFKLPLRGVAQKPTSTSQASTPSLEKKGRILVAEDLPMNQIVIAELLEAAGHEVTVVADGVAAIAAMRTATFDLVLMDMEMPVMGGLDATRIARSMGQTRATPIVALTANAMPAQVTACREAGMDDYLSKPIDCELLLHTVDRWIGQPSPVTTPSGVGTCDPVGDAALDRLEAHFGPEKALRFANMARDQMMRMLGYLPTCSDTAASAQAAHDLVSVAGNIGMHELSQQSRRLMVALQSDAGDVALVAKVLHAAIQAAILELDTRYPVQEPDLGKVHAAMPAA